MKVVGWISLILGILSFIGAFSKGHSVFGPIFFIGLGVFLLHRVSSREKDS